MAKESWLGYELPIHSKEKFMSSNEIKKDLLSQLLYEAQSYKRFEDIEKLVDSNQDFSMIPIQPLYLSLQSSSSDQVALILPKLSGEQRQALRDVDLWSKDNLDPKAFFRWIDVYSKCPDEEVILEFLKSEDFLVGLKNQFIIQTFDVEDPQYPEGDNYFLTEDNLLLIEYPENFSFVQELKELIRRLYAEEGVENAYAFLFKMVSDSYLVMEEECYYQMKERLRDFGLVDYYDALEYNSPFLNQTQIDAFLKNKKTLTPEIDSLSVNQVLHSSAVIFYQDRMEGIKKALETITEEKRKNFLHFSFIRLVNAQLTLSDALKSGTVSMGKVGLRVRQRLELGFDYIWEHLQSERKDDLFKIYDFFDLYKVGHSLIELTKKRINQALSRTHFEKEDLSYFLGLYWNNFLENSEEEVSRCKIEGSSVPMEINNLKAYDLWNSKADTFVKSLPFIESFFRELDKLKTEGQLNDQFYLNYEVENIDFEAIMISSLINFLAGHYELPGKGKMGVTISELKNFYQSFFKKHGEEYLLKPEDDAILAYKVRSFLERFGLEVVPGFSNFLFQILIDQLNGYEIDSMTEEDFKHVGGPILLSPLKN